MTPPVIERWIDIIENDRTAELDSLLFKALQTIIPKMAELLALP